MNNKQLKKQLSKIQYIMKNDSYIHDANRLAIVKNCEDVKKALERLEELEALSKATKPRLIYSDEPSCPTCNEVLDGDEEHCSSCDQRIDWS